MVKSPGLLLGALAVSAGVLLSMTGCAASGRVLVSNDSSEAVTIVSGNTEFSVTGGDQAEFTGSDCTPGDVTIRFPDEQTTELNGPICSDRKIVIRAGTATVEPA